MLIITMRSGSTIENLVMTALPGDWYLEVPHWHSSLNPSGAKAIPLLIYKAIVATTLIQACVDEVVVLSHSLYARFLLLSLSLPL